MDKLGNKVAQEGCDRCFCGCKYWENDRCIDCGTHIEEIRKESLETACTASREGVD